MNTKRLARWAGTLFALALLLPTTAVLMLYAPPVQNAATRWASAWLTQRTGMEIKAERVRLKFPLRVEVRGLHVGSLLSIEDIGIDIRPRLLRQGIIGANHLNAKGITIHTDTLSNISAQRFGADDITYNLRERRAHIHRVFLDDGYAALHGGASTQPRDSSPSTLPLSLTITDILLLHTEASYTDARTEVSSKAGRIALHGIAVDAALKASLQSLEIADGMLILKQGNTEPWTLTEVAARADSLHYTPTDIAGQLTHLTFKEAHGIDLKEGAATIAWADKKLSMPRLALRTQHSTIQGHLHAQNIGTKDIAIDADAGVHLGYADARFLTERIDGIPQAFVHLYPTETLSASIALQGSMKRLQLTRCHVSLPTAMDINVSGTAQELASTTRRTAQCHITAKTYDLDFLAALTDSTMKRRITIPPHITLQGDISYAPDTMHALCSLDIDKGIAILEGGYCPTSKAFALYVQTDSLDLRQIAPDEGMGIVSLQAHIEGNSLDYMQEGTTIRGDMQLRSLQWSGRTFTNASAQAVLADGHLLARAAYSDLLMKWNIAASVKQTLNTVEATIHTRIDDLNLRALHLTADDIRPTLQCRTTLEITPDSSYSLSSHFSNITLRTATQSIQPRPLTLQASLTPDTALLAIHSGDLTLQASAHTEGLPWQWTAGSNPLSHLAQLQATLTAGDDNPASNYLSLIGIKTDSIGLTAHYADNALRAHLQSGTLTWRTPGMTLQGRAHASLVWSKPFAPYDLSGVLYLSSVQYALPAYNLRLRIKDTLMIPFEQGGLTLTALPLYATEGNPLLLNGRVMLFGSTPTAHLHLTTSGTNLLHPQSTRETLLHGKALMSGDITFNGPFNALSITGNLQLRPNSSIHYIYKDAILTASNQLDNVLTFVSFEADTLTAPPSKAGIATNNLSVNLNISIAPTVQLEVSLGASKQNDVTLQGGGTLNLQYTPVTGMRLSGKYTIETGELNMNVPLLHVSHMAIRPGSSITWSGSPQNPQLNMVAEDHIRASVTLDGSPQSILFVTGVSLTDTMEKLDVQFTLEAPENATMQNTLASLSPEERGKLSVALLTTGLYLGEGGTGNLMNTALMGILQSQLDNISRDAFRTVDVSVGIEPLPDGVSGVSTRTDYSFSIAKRLWDNRIRIIIGGSVTTSNERIMDNAIIDNISIEWRISPIGSQYLRFFYDKNYESILEGEIREIGVGYAYRRRF